jgi:hypothetical protein
VERLVPPFVQDTNVLNTLQGDTPAQDAVVSINLCTPGQPRMTKVFVIQPLGRPRVDLSLKSEPFFNDSSVHS